MAGFSIVLEEGGDIQAAIDSLPATGGTILLKPGNYYPNSNIVLRSGIEIIGISGASTLIIFTNTDYCVRAEGSNVYTTGTVTVSNGSYTVTGIGTLWQDNLTISHQIKLGDFWYSIASIDSQTSLTLATKYIGEDLSGENYKAAIMVTELHLKNFTVYNGNVDGILLDYVYSSIFDGLYSIGNGRYGFKLTNIAQSTFKNCATRENGQSGIFGGDLDHTEFDVFWVYDNGGAGTYPGIYFSNPIFDCDFENVLARNNTDAGISLVNAQDITLHAGESAYNGAEGIKLVGCQRVIIHSMEIDGNTGDGVEIGADSNFNIVKGNVLKNNGGYGIEISTSNSDYNTIGINAYSDNTSGDYLDTGTNTQIAATKNYVDTKVNDQSASNYMKIGNQLICWGTGSISVAANTAGTAGTVVTFPLAFKAGTTPSIVIQATSLYSNAYGWTFSDSISNTGFTPRAVNKAAANTAGAQTHGWIATGVWQ